MGPKATLDRSGKSRPDSDSISGPSIPQSVAIPTELSRPLLWYELYLHSYGLETWSFALRERCELTCLAKRPGKHWVYKIENVQEHTGCIKYEISKEFRILRDEEICKVHKAR